MSNNESGLSDGALKWMMDRLTEVGVRFAKTEPYKITPDYKGVAHKPWLHSPWNYPGIQIGPRDLPGEMERHPSIASRMQEVGGVINEPGEAAIAYDPISFRSMHDVPSAESRIRIV